MENLDLTAVARMGLILAHLLAFAAAFAAVAFGDFAIFYRRRVNIELLTKAANGVTLALIALWITGLAAMLLMSIAVGLLPALRAQCLKIVDALAGR